MNDVMPIERSGLPKPVIHRRRWPSLLIWLLPLAALCVAIYYLRDRVADRGPLIAIHVQDATSIDANSTNVRSHGVEIGKVERVDLADDRNGAVLHVRLRREASDFARAGARFWLVKPDFSRGSFSGIGTMLSGPYLEAIAGGEGAPQRDTFDAMPSAPASTEPGLRFELIANAVDKVGPGTPITYRGIPVGVVESTQLSADATRVEIHAMVRQIYGPLVRVDSRFWAVSAADISGSIFSGIDLQLGSVKQLLAGEIAFVSPDNPLGEPAKPGQLFALHGEMDPAWKQWRPEIAITPEPVGTVATTQPSITVH